MVVGGSHDLIIYDLGPPGRVKLRQISRRGRSGGSLSLEIILASGDSGVRNRQLRIPGGPGSICGGGEPAHGAKGAGSPETVGESGIDPDMEGNGQ